MRELIKQYIKTNMTLNVTSLNPEYNQQLHRLVMRVEDSLCLDDSHDYVQIYNVPSKMETMWYDYKQEEKTYVIEGVEDMLEEKILEGVTYISSHEELMEICKELNIKPVLEEDGYLPNRGEVRFVKV